MKNTLPEIYRPLMGAPSIKLNHCAVCGRTYPLEQHHIVKRSAGKLFRAGVEVPKPTITLCGFGNNLKDANGYLCHGLAHHGRLHFRWVAQETKFAESFYGCGHWEYLLTDEPTKYQDALNMGGWKRLRSFNG